MLNLSLLKKKDSCGSISAKKAENYKFVCIICLISFVQNRF